MVQQAGTGSCAHPVGGTQLSLVQAFPSLQFVGGPLWHVPPAHVSPVVHALPSSHGALLLAYTQPLAGSQLSSVQTLWSSHSSGAPGAQNPSAQVSFVVQALPSSQGAVLSVCTHPFSGSQLSSVQVFPSSQFGAGPPTQIPLLHVSLVVHASSSSHGDALFTYWQPSCWSQLSSVQGFWSLQLRAFPTQLPPLQVSPNVHAFPSSQGLLLFVCVQPLPGSQLSSVQALPSSHAGAVPFWQTPPTQLSVPSQALWSSQSASVAHGWQFGSSTCWHPSIWSQLSAVQPLPSSQLSVGPPTQAPLAHASAVVQVFASEQGAALLLCVHPWAGSHASSVHPLPSSQFVGGPPTQPLTPPLH